MWLGLLEDNNVFLQLYLNGKMLEGPFFAAIDNLFQFYLQLHIVLMHCARSVHTATLSNSCLKACIGFALKLAEPLNGFLRALLEIPLTSQQGVDSCFL